MRGNSVWEFFRAEAYTFDRESKPSGAEASVFRDSLAARLKPCPSRSDLRDKLRF